MLGCQASVTFNRKCAHFKRKEQWVFRLDLVNEIALCYLQPLVKRLDECVLECLCVLMYMLVYAILYVLCVRVCTHFACVQYMCVFYVCVMCSVYMCVRRGYHHAMSVLLLDSVLQAGLYDMYLGQLVSRYIGSL